MIGLKNTKNVQFTGEKTYNLATLHDTIEQYLFLFCDTLKGYEWRFQHNNDSVHYSDSMKKLLSAKNDDVLGFNPD